MVYLYGENFGAGAINSDRVLQGPVRYEEGLLQWLGGSDEAVIGCNRLACPGVTLCTVLLGLNLIDHMIPKQNRGS